MVDLILKLTCAGEAYSNHSRKPYSAMECNNDLALLVCLFVCFFFVFYL